MTTTYGITATGFVKKPLLVIKADIEAAWRVQFGNDVDLSPQSPDGQVVGIWAERYADLWDLAEGIYMSRDPDQAGGTALDAVAALTGTLRQVPTHSTVTQTLCCTDATHPATVPAGTVFSVAGLNKFQTLASAVPLFTEDIISNGIDFGYNAGGRGWVTYGGVTRIYQCTVGGALNANTGGIATGSEALVIVDSTVTWSYIGRGSAAVDVACASLDYGAIAAPARTLSTIETPVSGLLSVVNLLDAKLGQLAELDMNYRVRREGELRATGNAAADAIRGDVLQASQATVTPVTGCTVLINDTDVTDVNGVPPHAVEVLVLGGVDQDVANAILGSVGAGISTYGTTTASAVDLAGQAHVVKFSRPTAKTVYIAATVTYDARLYPSDGDTRIKAAMVAAGALSVPGQDVVSAFLASKAFGIPGVLDCSPCNIKLTAGPTSPVTLAIALRELATFDTSRVSITSTPAVP